MEQAGEAARRDLHAEPGPQQANELCQRHAHLGVQLDDERGQPWGLVNPRRAAAASLPPVPCTGPAAWAPAAPLLHGFSRLYPVTKDHRSYTKSRRRPTSLPPCEGSRHTRPQPACSTEPRPPWASPQRQVGVSG